MPRRPQDFVDGATYHVGCTNTNGARVFAAPEEAFKRRVDAIEAEPRRRLCMSGANLKVSTAPDLEVLLLWCRSVWSVIRWRWSSRRANVRPRRPARSSSACRGSGRCRGARALARSSNMSRMYCMPCQAGYSCSLRSDGARDLDERVERSQTPGAEEAELLAGHLADDLCQFTGASLIAGDSQRAGSGASRAALAVNAAVSSIVVKSMRWSASPQ